MNAEEITSVVLTDVFYVVEQNVKFFNHSYDKYLTKTYTKNLLTLR